MPVGAKPHRWRIVGATEHTTACRSAVSLPPFRQVRRSLREKRVGEPVVVPFREDGGFLGGLVQRISRESAKPFG